LIEIPQIGTKYGILIMLKLNPGIFKKTSLGGCSRSVWFIWALNHCYNLKTQGGDTFKKKYFDSFVRSFLTGRAICHTQMFCRMQVFCSNISKRGHIWSNNLYCSGNWCQWFLGFQRLRTVRQMQTGHFWNIHWEVLSLISRFH
jgi:hypothetical protein